MQGNQVTGVILCGGKSRRMGFNKALLKINDKYVIQETENKLKKIFQRIILLTNNRTPFDAIDNFSESEILEDSYTDMGPLGGITTALENVSTPYVFVVACDIPNVDLKAVSNLANRNKSMEAQVLLYRINGKIEPLFGYYHYTCLPIFKEQLLDGEKRIRQGFSELKVKIIDTADFKLGNVNTPDELKEWSI